MISIAEWSNPTRIVGLSSNLFALLSCGIARVRGGGAPHGRWLASVLAALEAALFLDMVFDGRWLLHDLLDSEAIASNLYAFRGGPQVAALGLLGGVVVAGIVFTRRRLLGRTGAYLAVCGGILSLSCWCVEVISLHAVDAVLYHIVDEVKVVGFVWIACSLMTSAGILWDAFATNTHAR